MLAPMNVVMLSLVSICVLLLRGYGGEGEGKGEGLAALRH